MKLNQDQIQELYIFTRKHFVEHYDLQTELVDHLANGIEQQLEATPNLTFHDALNREFKKFGIFGFQDVISERMKAMDKKYRSLIWRFYREFFKLPKIALTLFLTMVYFSLLLLMAPEDSYYVFMGTLLVGLIPFLYKSWQYKKRLNKKARKWMLEEMIFTQMGWFNIGLLPMHVFNLSINSDGLYLNQWFLLGLSFFIACFFILFYVVVYIIPPKAEELLAETYPEYKMA
jgi:hypothetical protein